MIYLPEIVRDVKKIINEAGDEEEALLITEDKVNLDLYIEEAISSSVLFFQHNVPWHVFNQKTDNGITVSRVHGDKECGVITLPKDFVRLIGVQLSHWKRMATEIYPIGSEEWKHQQNPHSRAGIWKPVCTDGTDMGGNKAILCYALPDTISSPSVTFFSYEARFNIDDGLNLEKGNVYKAVVYKAASLVYAIYQQYDASVRLETEAIKFLRNQKDKQNE